MLVLSLVLLSSNNVTGIVSSSSSSSLSNFTFVEKIPLEGTSEIQIFQPEGVDTDSEGNIYVNDIGPNRIVKFSENGTYILSWGSTGSDDGQFNHVHNDIFYNQGQAY